MSDVKTRMQDTKASSLLLLQGERLIAPAFHQAALTVPFALTAVLVRSHQKLSTQLPKNIFSSLKNSLAKGTILKRVKKKKKIG